MAAARPAAGLAARGHFAPAPGPVQVVHRDPARIAVLAGVAAAGAAGMIIALVVLTLLTVRTVRDRRRLAAVGPAVPAARYGAARCPDAQRGADRAAGIGGPGAGWDSRAGRTGGPGGAGPDQAGE